MKLPRILIITLLILLLYASGFSQNTSVSDVAHTSNSSAVLNVYSTSKGMLASRMAQVQRTAIFAPAIGLLVYQTNCDATGRAIRNKCVD